MILGRVRGNVISTEKHPWYVSHRLLLIEPVDGDGKKSGGCFVAVDAVSAGPGELVLITDEGNSARLIFDAPGAPVRCVVSAIIDSLDFDSGGGNA